MAPVHTADLQMGSAPRHPSPSLPIAQAARDALLVSNLRLVVSIAKRFLGKGEPTEDGAGGGPKKEIRTPRVFLF